MNLHQLILTKNDCYKAGKTIVPKGIMVHSTGAANATLKRYVGPDDGLLGINKYNNHWNMSGTTVCVHAFIGLLENGTVATYQTLPWNMRGWHCGRTYINGPTGNDTHISIEICEDNLTDAKYFNTVYKEATELCVMLCKQYNLDPLKDGVLIDHADGWRRCFASDHGDVEYWFKKFGKSMNTFRNDVSTLLFEPAKEVEKDMTKDEVISIIEAWEAEKAKKSESAWSIKEGYFAKAKTANVILNTAPQVNITCEQLAAIIGRLGLIK